MTIARRNHNLKRLDLSPTTKHVPQKKYAPHPVEWVQSVLYSTDPLTGKPYTGLVAWMTDNTARELHRKANIYMVQSDPTKPLPDKILGIPLNKLSALQSNGVIVITQEKRVIGCRFFGDLT